MLILQDSYKLKSINKNFLANFNDFHLQYIPQTCTSSTNIKDELKLQRMRFNSITILLNIIVLLDMKS